MIKFILGLVMAVALLATIGTAKAHAERVESGDNGKSWFTLKGEKLSALEAYRQSGKFLQCSVVEVVINEKTGKPSIKK